FPHLAGSTLGFRPARVPQRWRRARMYRPPANRDEPPPPGPGQGRISVDPADQPPCPVPPVAPQLAVPAASPARAVGPGETDGSGHPGDEPGTAPRGSACVHLQFGPAPPPPDAAGAFASKSLPAGPGGARVRRLAGPLPADSPRLPRP